MPHFLMQIGCFRLRLQCTCQLPSCNATVSCAAGSSCDLTWNKVRLRRVERGTACAFMCCGLMSENLHPLQQFKASARQWFVLRGVPLRLFNVSRHLPSKQHLWVTFVGLLFSQRVLEACTEAIDLKHGSLALHSRILLNPLLPTTLSHQHPSVLWLFQKSHTESCVSCHASVSKAHGG